MQIRLAVERRGDDASFLPCPTASRNYIIISAISILIHHFGRFFIKKVLRCGDGIL